MFCLHGALERVRLFFKRHFSITIMKKYLSLPHIIICIGLLQIIIYYFIGTFETPHQFSVACPQFDTLLYCQSARQIANGQPFVFTPGDLPSTGCTSHLYPFILTIPYILGMTGPKLLLGGFIINAFFYMVFLYSWFLIIKKVLDNDKTRLVAVLLIAFSGHAAISALNQSDVGLFMALSSSLFAAWLYEKTLLFNILLVLSPWTRPEGMMITAAIGFIYVVKYFCGVKLTKSEIISLCLGITSSLGVFIFNYYLTGVFQFHSIEYKGYFKRHGFFIALQMSLDDLVQICRHILLCIPGENANRSIYAFPLLGAVAAIFGIVAEKWDFTSRYWKMATWGLACLFGITSVAVSGWQNTNLDRYLAWIFPFGIIFVAKGITVLSEKTKRTDLYYLLLSVFVIFQCISAAGFISRFAFSSRYCQQHYDSLLSMGEIIETDKTIGSAKSSSAYALKGNRLKHLSGLYSPEFRSPSPYLNIEVLKHRPESRFDYWEFDTSRPEIGGYDVSAIATNQIFTGIEGTALYTTSWKALDNALCPCTNLINRLSLSARMDVGFSSDEKKASFKVFSRLQNLEYFPFVMTGTYSNTNNILIDVGIPVTGWAEMTVPLIAEKDALCIIRTTDSAKKVSWNRNNTGTVVHFKSPLRLRMSINGEMLPVVSAPIQQERQMFTDIVLSIPGKYITENENHIEIYGDHIAFCYWFYQ